MISTHAINGIFAVLSDGARSWSFIDIARVIIIVIAVCAVVFIACKAMGIQIPQWAIQIGVVVLVAFVAIVAISLLATM